MGQHVEERNCDFQVGSVAGLMESAQNRAKQAPIVRPKR